MEYGIPHSVTRSFATVALLILIASFPQSVHAEAASVDAILGAIAEVQKLDSCLVTKKSVSDDCIKTRTWCTKGDEDYWGKRYEMVGGTVVAKQGVTDPLALDWLRADWATNSKTHPPIVQSATCYCQCPANATFEPCTGKPQGTPFRTAEDLVYERCAARCAPNPIADKCAGQLPPVSQKTTSAATAIAGGASYTEDTTCFTTDECATQKGTFEAYDKCKNGKGRCFASEPVVRLNTQIGSVIEVQGFSGYVITAYRWLISVAAVAATVMFTFGAFLYLLGSAITSIQKGKTYMIDAVFGLLLVLGANFILRTINPATLNLNPIKVYMVNPLVFVQGVSCKDLGNVNTALAGTKPTLKPYEEVSKDPKNFSIPASQTECGKLYWVERSVGSACDGWSCPKGEGCTSCASGVPANCEGAKSDRMVCDRAMFTGVVNYIDKRYPAEVDLMAVCNNALSTDQKIVWSNMDTLDTVSLKRVGVQTGQGTTDEDVSGVSGYSFTISANKMNVAINDTCKDKGGFRGALLGLVYHENWGINDVAIVSRKNCGGGAFDGYADGTAGHVGDTARAFVCGYSQGKLVNGSDYWSAKELQDAVNGNAITCDFRLSDANAPDDPAGSMCGTNSTSLTNNPNCRSGASCAVAGSQCQSAVEVCTCLADKTLGQCKAR